MNTHRPNPCVVIVGAGMTGILLAIKLKQAGIINITVLEKKDSIGGTWRENTYPGVACDVPSHAYTYSFEPNPDWSSHFPSGSEIHQYFDKVSHKYDIYKHIHFNEAVTSCIYNDSTDSENNHGKWSVKTSRGNTLNADLLFCATGILHHPVIPDIPGLKTFTGPAFHSARWDHSVELTGKRIGVIGTGSTAAQIIPELVNMSGTEVSVFQRTAQWTVKIGNRTFTDREKQRFRRQPFRMKLIRKLSAIIFSRATGALTGDGWLDKLTHKLMTFNGQKNLKDSIRDPELRAKLTPDYKFGCKRVVITSSFYDAIQQPNAHLVTEPIERIEADGIVTNSVGADGSTGSRRHPLDIIVLATGFNPAAFMRPMEFIGRAGVSIEQLWQKKTQAYRSLFLPNFPNCFIMLGPNSPIGNQSVIEISEIQTDYLLQLIKQWQAGKLATIEATPDALQCWNAMLKSRMKNTVWTSGCQSWYLDADGDALAWPDSWKRWVAAMAKPDINDFITAAVDAPSHRTGSAD